MSTSELEELLTRRTELEEESQSLTEEQKNLEERVKVLEEKIAIEELKNNNKTTQEAISQLESKISELEQKLKEKARVHEKPELAEETIPETSEAHEPSEEATPEIIARVPEEPEEETVTVTAFEDTMTQQERDQNFKKQSEKKRRKFF